MSDDSPALSPKKTDAPMLGGEDWQLHCDWCDRRVLKTTLYFGSVNSVWGLCPDCLAKVEWLDKLKLNSYYSFKTGISTIIPVNINPHARYIMEGGRARGYLARAMAQALRDNTTVLRAMSELIIDDPPEDS